MTNEQRMEAMRQRLDETAPTLEQAVLSVQQGQVNLMSAYRENEQRLYARIKAAEMVIDAVRTAQDPTDAIAAYDALLAAEKRRVWEYIQSLHK